MKGTEWDAPAQITVKKGSGEEETALSSGGGEVGHRQGIQILWSPPGYGELLPIPGTGNLGFIQQLSSGGKELVPGEGCVEEDDKNLQHGGDGTAGVRLHF